MTCRRPLRASSVRAHGPHRHCHPKPCHTRRRRAFPRWRCRRLMTCTEATPVVARHSGTGDVQATRTSERGAFALFSLVRAPRQPSLPRRSRAETPRTVANDDELEDVAVRRLRRHLFEDGRATSGTDDGGLASQRQSQRACWQVPFARTQALRHKRVCASTGTVSGSIYSNIKRF